MINVLFGAECENRTKRRADDGKMRSALSSSAHYFVNNFETGKERYNILDNFHFFLFLSN